MLLMSTYLPALLKIAIISIPFTFLFIVCQYLYNFIYYIHFEILHFRVDSIQIMRMKSSGLDFLHFPHLKWFANFSQ